NIGWNSGYSDPAANVNIQFMDSSPHRANILGAYDELGVGSWFTPGPWNYAGSGCPSAGCSDVYMFSQEFAEVPGAGPPPPPPPPPPPTPSSGGGGGGSNPTPAPTPTPAATPTPTPTPTVRHHRPRRGTFARPLEPGRTLLGGTIEQVISSYLDE
ncbi:MAG: CAP domain-containing protein, partial [Candidatus Dormibacteria bacterium]